MDKLSGMINSLTSKNIVSYKPNKKALIVSLVSALKIILGGVFSIEGEKIINPDGYTLKMNEEYYDYKYSSRTRLYITIGFFLISFGILLFFLFTIEFKKIIHLKKKKQ